MELLWKNHSGKLQKHLFYRDFDFFFCTCLWCTCILECIPACVWEYMWLYEPGCACGGWDLLLGILQSISTLFIESSPSFVLRGPDYVESGQLACSGISCHWTGPTERHHTNKAFMWVVEGKWLSTFKLGSSCYRANWLHSSFYHRFFDTEIHLCYYWAWRSVSTGSCFLAW